MALSFKLEATVNHLIIRGDYALYTFLVEKDAMLRKNTSSHRGIACNIITNPLLLKIGSGGSE